MKVKCPDEVAELAPRAASYRAGWRWVAFDKKCGSFVDLRIE
jgi:hypothetical protein